MAAYFKTESFSAREKITYRLLQTRLIKTVNTRIQNGEFTERGLAKLAGISQPQIHHVLKGARKLSTELADRLLRALRLTALDLIDDEEIAMEHAVRRGEPKCSEQMSSAARNHSTTSPRKKPGQEEGFLSRAAQSTR